MGAMLNYSVIDSESTNIQEAKDQGKVVLALNE